MITKKQPLRILLIVSLSVVGFITPTQAATAPLPTVKSYTALLEEQIQAMVNAGHLRTAYSLAHNHIYLNYAYTDSTTKITINQFDDVFHNPADTLYTLVSAYPHLSSTLKTQVLSYIDQYYTCRAISPPPYSVCTTTHIGISGVKREVNDIPEPALAPLTGALPNGYSVGTGPQEPSWTGWTFNPFNYYALYRYAAITSNPQATANTILSALNAAGHAKPGLLPTDDNFVRLRPHLLNSYIAGYYGYLGLLTLNNQSVDSVIQTQLTSALQKRVQILPRIRTISPTPFPTTDPRYPYEIPDPPEYEAIHQSTLEAGGFLWLTPELGDYLYQHALKDTRWAIEAYEKSKPYWSIPRVDETMRINVSFNEGTVSHLYDTSSLFLARAFALKLPVENLAPYLDAPAYPLGDLFYIQNLVAILEAPTDPNYTPAPTAPPPLPGDLDGDDDLDFLDFKALIGAFNTIPPFNLIGDPIINIFDFSHLISFL